MKNKEPLQDELTEAMHSEFTVDDETEIYLRCITIWCYHDIKTDDDLLSLCVSYGVQFADALKYKDACLKLKNE
jgi:hypothetical protein